MAGHSIQAASACLSSSSRARRFLPLLNAWIYGLAIGFLSEIVSGIGFGTLGNVILPLVVIAILYYRVVVSRFPGEQSLPRTTS